MPFADPEEKRAYDKRYFSENRERKAAYDREVRERNASYVDAHLAENPCVDCGEDDAEVLEFDHVGEKITHVSHAVHRCWSIAALAREIAKCEVVCANCHRRRTNRRIRARRGGLLIGELRLAAVSE